MLLAAAALRELWTGRERGSLKVVGIVLLLAATNVSFHLEAHFEGTAEYATRAGVALVVTLVGVIGGRIVPLHPQLARAQTSWADADTLWAA